VLEAVAKVAADALSGNGEHACGSR
jgi:hypothetical protein